MGAAGFRVGGGRAGQRWSKLAIVLGQRPVVGRGRRGCKDEKREE